MKIHPFWLIISQQFISLTLCSQINLNNVAVLFAEYHNSVKEKIYMHTDKKFYLAGEIAWYKLYSVNASDNTPLELSKVAYVEILDQANKPRLQAKIALNNAEGNGSFYLPFTLASGNYKLRAYTSWMKNFGADYFFEKSITVINIQRKMPFPAIKTPDEIDIQFFPEGGNLVANLKSTIAFKGVDQYGRGLTFTGVIIDSKDTLLSFKTEHAGMGAFAFTPLSNKIYKAIILLPSGETIAKDLPPVYSSGYVLSVTDSADKIRVMVESDVLQERQIYLFAHTREKIKAAIDKYSLNGKAVFLLDKHLLGDGISHITIFNDQKQPVCERLYFKKPTNRLEIQINTDELVYKTRQKVKVNIQPSNTTITRDSASFSLAVYRLDSLQSLNDVQINTYLLLTSDLTGFVEDPNYYLSNDDRETNTALDYLMLTNGWRRFKWPEVFAGNKPFFNSIPEFNGQIILGNVVNTKTGGAAAGVRTYLGMPGLQTAFSTAVSDKDGRVKFELNNLHSSSEMILQPDSFNDSIYRIDISNPFSNAFSATPFPPFTLHQNTAGALRELSIAMQVQNIYSGKKLKNYLTPPFDTTAFYINPDAKYLLDNYTRFTTIEEVLREYVTMVDVRKKDGRVHFAVFDVASKQMFKTDPLVLLDAVPVFDLDKFMNIDPLKLYKLEVLNRKYFLGRSIFTGVLNWTSYKRDMADYETSSRATIIDYDGLQLQREFYAPAYTNESQQTSHLPDYRNVLFWSPAIKIATGQNKVVDFYTSDLPGKFAVEVQGLAKSGLCSSKVFIIEVKNN